MAKIIASIDIGSSKIVVLVSQYQDGIFNILGIGTKKSDGFKKGAVVDIASIVPVIKDTISEAENMSGYQINEVIAGISGCGIKSVESTGSVSIRYGEVDEYSISRALRDAENITMSANQEILHVFPNYFVINNLSEVDNPLGMHGDDLKAHVHIITNDKNITQNTIKSISQCGVDVANTILNIVAVSESLLTKDEKNSGTCVIDIGYDTTDIAIYKDSSICYTEVLDIAGNSVTNDVAYAFSASQDDAEGFKVNHGYALEKLISEEIFIDVQYSGDSQAKQLSSRTLSKVIEARYEEIFNLIKKSLETKNYINLVDAVVITGGGAKIKGCANLAEIIFNRPVRIGTIGINDNIKGADHLNNDSCYTTSIGLLVFSQNKNINNNLSSDNLQKKSLWIKFKKFIKRI